MKYGDEIRSRFLSLKLVSEIVAVRVRCGLTTGGLLEDPEPSRESPRETLIMDHYRGRNEFTYVRLPRLQQSRRRSEWAEGGGERYVSGPLVGLQPTLAVVTLSSDI